MPILFKPDAIALATPFDSKKENDAVHIISKQGDLLYGASFTSLVCSMVMG